MSDKSLSLYHIEEELQAFVDSEALVPEDKQQEFQQEFLAKTQAAVAKRGRCIQAIRHLESQIDLARAEEKRLSEWRKSLESGLDRFKDYIVRCLEIGGQKKAEADNGSLSIQSNPESVDITDIDQVPDEFKTVTVKMPAALFNELVEPYLLATEKHSVDVTFNPDKAAIKGALKAGREVPGADLRYGKWSLRVR